MAFTLTKDNLTKTAATVAQCTELIALGFVVTGGSADDTTALAEFPYFQESMTDTVNPNFRGNGFEGESGTIMALAKVQQPSISVTDYEALMANIGNNGDVVATSMTQIVICATALPTSQQSTTKLYSLSAYDGVASKAAGLYSWSGSAWAAYPA